MNRNQKIHSSRPITVFRERVLPETATPVGYAALIDTYDLQVPLPRRLSAIGERHRVFQQGEWKIFTPRHMPPPSLEGQLTFALKYEGVDLAVLGKLFNEVPAGELADWVRSTPTGAYSRRIWFLFEWLTGSTLDLEDAKAGAYVRAVDPKQQWTIKGEKSARHHVVNNLPGTPAFCPLVHRSKILDHFAQMKLSSRAKRLAADLPRDLLARTAAFLLLSDSRSSFAIEGESPPEDRIQRWGRAIGEAGKRPLDLNELLRLQRIVIGDARFVPLGLREEGGFIGAHDRTTHMPLPTHISARHADLPSLMDGLLAYDRRASGDIDPVIAAASLAFGFVYIHPFVDGNGRLHRYLIHHVLAHSGFAPRGFVFPVSAAILESIDEYRTVLESYSDRLLPLIEWEATDTGNVRVLNETIDGYRYFDATPHAEFLYASVQETIEVAIPREAEFLRRYDKFRSGMEALVDMPNRSTDLLFRFLHQNDGRLSKRAKEKEFSALSAEEADRVEGIYRNAFNS